MDLTQAVAPWINELNGKVANFWTLNGKWYGVPYDQHAVGFWYRKDLFQQAGISSPPTTMDELNADVVKLKQAGIPAIAIGSKDRWPDAFYWDYFAVRECPTDVLKSSASLKLTDPCWVKAGNDLQAFLATNPFQTAFLGTPAQTGAGSSAGMLANGKAAMELQGDWEPTTMVSLTTDTNLVSKMGWFPFPAVPGGKGDPKVVLGGGDGFACTTQATGACVDFLKYISSTTVQDKIASQALLVPINPAAASAITDPNVKANLQALQDAPYVQNYFDTAFPFAVGQSLDDAVANYFAGKGSPQTIVQSVTQASSGGK
jgi:raffinose/stachyose/melibiose transport system substrate-binding protein